MTILTAALLFAAWAGVSAANAALPFYMGADISMESLSSNASQFTQNPPDANVTLSDNGVPGNVDQILYDHGANVFRLRIFVNPSNLTYTGSSLGAFQTQAYDIALAQQIKADAPGAKILLDFHYSNTWADPGRQTKPGAISGGLGWGSDTTISQLESDVQSYTANTLTAFKSAGVLPDIVQIGNETTDGMLWQTGSSGAAAVGGRLLFQGTSYPGLGLTNNKPTQAQTNQSWQNFGGLLNAAIAGVRTVQGTGPRIPVALSIDSGDLNGQPQFFYSDIQNPTLGNVTDFDIEGVDYYPSTGNSQKSFAFLQSNLKALANTNTNNGTNKDPSKRIMLLENNYPYTGTSNAIPMWETGGVATPAQQEAEFLAVRNTMLGLPGNDGEGVLYWYPEAVQVSGFNIYNGGNTALFDATSAHNALQTITDNVFAPLHGDFNGDGKFDAADVSAMLKALADLNGYQSARGLTAPDIKLLGDFNGDGLVTSADLQGMILALKSGDGSLNPVPEPAAAWLLVFSGIVVFGYLVCKRDYLSHPQS